MVRKVSDGECKMGLVGMVVFFSLKFLATSSWMESWVYF